MINNAEGLIEEINKVCNGYDEYQTSRERVRSILIEHSDASSASRVWNEIKAILNEV